MPPPLDRMAGPMGEERVESELMLLAIPAQYRNSLLYLSGPYLKG